MKIITEAQLRAEFKRSLPESYTVPSGMRLTPAAREHLQTNKVRILYADAEAVRGAPGDGRAVSQGMQQDAPQDTPWNTPQNTPRYDGVYGGSRGGNSAQGVAGAQGAVGAQGVIGAQGAVGAQGVIGAQGVTGAQSATGAQGVIGAQAQTTQPTTQPSAPPLAPAAETKPRYVDAVTQAVFYQKPEYMTHIHGNQLVLKNHPRIVLRGKLDSLQAAILLVQVEVMDAYPWLADALEDALGFVRNLLRCEVLSEPVPEWKLLGFTEAELRDRSHHPQKYYAVPPMLLPNCRMGAAYLRLNALRAQSREVELAAMNAFWVDGRMTNEAFMQALNRLSSVLYILMCQLAAAQKAEA